jgi:2-polyprenyl-3-methyl-5-hydroxy-6-metoxy-1,4-benzoquinol methylase
MFADPVGVEKAQTGCPLCGAAGARVLSRRARDGSPLETVLCEGCGLGRVNPLPSAEDLAAFYRDSYRLLYKQTYEPKPHHVLRATRVAVERFGRLKDVLTQGTLLVDVGSGGGEFLYLARAAGCRTMGIEPNQGYASYAREQLGLEIRAGGIQDQEFAPGAIDVITLFHVLEHLPDPVGSLSRAARWLRPGGFAFVEAPNLASTCEHPAHRFHRAHLLHFSAATLERCGESSGLVPVRTEAPGDGANLMVLFRSEPGHGPLPRPAGENFARLWALEQSRRAGRYWVSPGTWLRTLRRLCRMAEERLAARSYPSRRAILDAAASAIL